MKHFSIVFLSSAALIGGAFNACSSDDTSTPGSGGSSTTSATGSGGTGTTATTGSGGTQTGSSGGAGGATGGSAGNGGNAGSGGSSAGAGPEAGVDASAGDAKLEGGAAKAMANIMPLPDGTITGTATFVASGANVMLTVALDNCPAGVHPIHIHAGTGCGATEQGTHWDPPRGDTIGPNSTITCGTDMKGMLTHTRLGTEAKPWTIGGPSASDVVGHPMIVHGVGESSMVRAGCGVIRLVQ